MYSDDLIVRVKGFEDLRLQSYLDACGVPTIGYGHTGIDVKLGMSESASKSDEDLVSDLKRANMQMLHLVKVPLTQGQEDALTDFVYNLGISRLAASELLQVLNSRNYAGVPHELYHVNPDGTEHGWIFGNGGVVLPGLVERRKAEIQMWNTEAS